VGCEDEQGNGKPLLGKEANRHGSGYCAAKKDQEERGWFFINTLGMKNRKTVS